MDTHSRIQDLANNNSEMENSRNKSHAKISEFTVCVSHVLFHLISLTDDKGNSASTVYVEMCIINRYCHLLARDRASVAY